MLQRASSSLTLASTGRGMNVINRAIDTQEDSVPLIYTRYTPKIQFSERISQESAERQLICDTFTAVSPGEDGRVRKGSGFYYRVTFRLFSPRTDESINHRLHKTSERGEKWLPRLKTQARLQKWNRGKINLFPLVFNHLT